MWLWKLSQTISIHPFWKYFLLAGWLQLMGKKWCERPAPSHGKIGILQRSELTGEMSSSEVHTDTGDIWHVLAIFLVCASAGTSSSTSGGWFLATWTTRPTSKSHFSCYLRQTILPVPSLGTTLTGTFPWMPLCLSHYSLLTFGTSYAGPSYQISLWKKKRWYRHWSIVLGFPRHCCLFLCGSNHSDVEASGK